MKRWLITCILTAIVCTMLLPLTGNADSGQFYFVGMTAPRGSLSPIGSEHNAVYLRWDIVEGSFPDEIQAFMLERDNMDIARLPDVGTLSDNPLLPVQTVFDGPENERRKLEVINLLNQSQNGTVNEENYTSVLFSKLNNLPDNEKYDSFWSELGSRMHFPIARARYRGYLDTEVSGGTRVYRLWGLYDPGNGTEARTLLGQTVVDAGVATVMPAAKNFKMTRQGRCDAPEQYKDHGTVSLYWEYGSSAGNVTETFIHSLLISGFDIYRTTKSLQEIDSGKVDYPADKFLVDIRQVALNSHHRADGTISLDYVETHDKDGNRTLGFFKLEKVNDVPLTITANTDEYRYKGWNPESPPQYVEMPLDIKEAGFRPGDKLLYYLVGRDYTGNYSDTVNLIVTVPDYDLPQAPWKVEVSQRTDPVKLIWDHVSVQAYYDNFKSGRQYCNLATAEADKELCFTTEGRSCGEKANFCKDLDVDNYLVYRFDDPSEAGSFVDSDGDGYSDTDERSTLSSDPALTDSGTACTPCDAASGEGCPSVGKNYLLGVVPVSSVVMKNGREVIEFEDTTAGAPQDNEKKVFWYRIASRDSNGNMSISSTVEVSYLNKKKPLRPRLCVDEQDTACVEFESECNHKAQPNTTDPKWSEIVDRTGDASSMNLTCEYYDGEIISFYDSSFTNNNGIRIASIDGVNNACDVIGDVDSKTTCSITFYDVEGGVLQSINDNDSSYTCWNLPELICEGYEDIAEGDIITDLPLRFIVPLGPNECVNLYSNLEDQDVKLKIDDRAFADYNGNGIHDQSEPSGNCCGDIQCTIDIKLNETDLPAGEDVCLSLDVINEYNAKSAKLRLPCTKIAKSGPPGPPSPVEIIYDESNAHVTWNLPSESVSGTILEWYLKGGTEAGQHSGSQFVPQTVSHTVDGIMQYSFSVGPATVQQEWCFRARSVGYSQPGDVSKALSGWSDKLCGLRPLPGDPDPQYMPWPAVAESPNLGSIDVIYSHADFVFFIKLSEQINDKGCNFNSSDKCDYGKGVCLYPTTCERLGTNSFCALLTMGVNSKLNYVAYRQSRKTSSDVPGNFIQVSPLIDTVHCKSRFQGSWLDELSDPFINYKKFQYFSAEWNGRMLVFADRFPHICGQEYRYQFVYFSEKGEITGYKHSDWALADCH